jgi:hypothetical protein
MAEWALDWNTAQLITPCDNCAALDGGTLDGDADIDGGDVGRLQWSGGYDMTADEIYTYDDYYVYPTVLFDDDGIRCARDP